MLKVMVGNGNHRAAEGLIKNLAIAIQDHTLNMPVYLFPFLGADLILGIGYKLLEHTLQITSICR